MLKYTTIRLYFLLIMITCIHSHFKPSSFCFKCILPSVNSCAAAFFAAKSLTIDLSRACVFFSFANVIGLVACICAKHLGADRSMVGNILRTTKYLSLTVFALQIILSFELCIGGYFLFSLFNLFAGMLLALSLAHSVILSHISSEVRNAVKRAIFFVNIAVFCIINISLFRASI